MIQLFKSKTTGIFVRNLSLLSFLLLIVEFFTPWQVGPIIGIPLVITVSLLAVLFSAVRIALLKRPQVWQLLLGSISTSVLTTLFVWFELIHPIGALVVILALGFVSIQILSQTKSLYTELVRPLYSVTLIAILLLLILRGLEILTWVQLSSGALSITQALGQVEMILIAHMLSLGGMLMYLDRHFDLVSIRWSETRDSSTAQDPLGSSKWYRKPENLYWLGVGGITILSFGLRIWNLTILDPYTDEYLHLTAAKRFVETGFLDYSRAQLVTFSAVLAYWIGQPESFYDYLFWGRLPGVIFSSLTVIPLYVLASQINRKIGLIAALLWAVSPWAIGVGRAIREYAYYPFFTLWILILLIWIIRHFERVRGSFRSTKLWLASGTIAVFVYYAYAIDRLSTLKVSFIPILAILSFYAITHYRPLISFYKQQKKSVLFGSVAALIAGISMIFWYVATNSQVDISTFTPDLRWIQYLFFVQGSPTIQWWSGSAYMFIGFLSVLAGTIYAITTKNKRYFLVFWIFALMLFFYVYLFDRYARPRYIFHILPYLTVLVATSFYGVFECIQLPRLKGIWQGMSVSLLILIILVSNTLYPLTSTDHQYVGTTNEYHDRVYPTLQMLESEISDEDVFVTTIMGRALYLAFDVEQDDITVYRYRNRDRFEVVEEVVSQNSQGWMILDSRRNGGWSEGYPKEGHFFIGTTKVEVIQDKDGLQVYRWDRN